MGRYLSQGTREDVLKRVNAALSAQDLSDERKSLVETLLSPLWERTVALGEMRDAGLKSWVWVWVFVARSAPRPAPLDPGRRGRDIIGSA